MNDFHIRPVDPRSQREIDHVAVFSVMTLWEARPEMRVNPATIQDFGFDAHSKMVQAGVSSPQQQHLIAVDGEARIAGHSIVLLRHDADDKAYGYFWSRYVLPRYRRQGLARAFLKRGLAWFDERQVPYSEVHIHVDNDPLRALFESEGFTVADRRIEQWTYLVLRRPGTVAS